MKKSKQLSETLPDNPEVRLTDIEILRIEKILTHSEKEYGPLASIHQAYGLLAEELNKEFFDIVCLKRKKRDAEHIREELFQLAAQAIKTARYADTFVGAERDNRGYLKD
jgi:hypothetical protein